jgi:lysophospholipase L1-like esterase
VEAWVPANYATVAIVGDSITDGRGSTSNANDRYVLLFWAHFSLFETLLYNENLLTAVLLLTRWTDQFLTRLQASSSTKNVGILNQAAGGNRILADGLGPNAIGRIDRDVLAQSGVKWAIIFEGVNDIGTANADSASQTTVATNVIAALDQMVTRIHAQGIKVFGATITPFGGQGQSYDDAGGLREKSRQTINDWIRTSGRVDAVLDFDKAVRDPSNAKQIASQYDSGDHLHLNPAGYKAIAASIPLDLFESRTLPGNFGFT